MGNDGGSIPKRRELVKEAQKDPSASELKFTQTEHLAHAWRHCALTDLPLQRPVVSDSLGRLFNKEGVLEYLLSKPEDDMAVAKKKEQDDIVNGTITSLKDVVELKLEVEQENTMANHESAQRREKWVCPVTCKELDEDVRAVYLVPCGHVFEAVAVKEVSGESCIQCGEAYAPNDVIPILPTTKNVIAHLTLRMRTLATQGLAHSLKKASKKSKKRKLEANESTASTPSQRDDAPASKMNGSHLSNSINNATTASLTAKVMEEQEERNKKRKMAQSRIVNALYAESKGPKRHNARDADYLSRGFSIPANNKS